MTDVITLAIASWDQQATMAAQELAVDALELGSVLLFPQLSFSIQDGDDRLLSPMIAGKGKNVSLDPSAGSLRGSSSSVNEADLQRLKDMIERFAASSRNLLRNLLPQYETGLEQARTSFRPVEIAGRRTSWRKDDTRLHVDSFPSSPTQGNRILRVFTNINPYGRSRNWRLGEPFEGVARRFLPSLRGPIWGTDRVLDLLGITKRRRTAYDHYMLQLHDRMKADLAYQSQVAQRAYDFQTGSTWMVFSDLVSHAAMSGQYALEQTYHLPVNSMVDPSRAPLRILEKLLGRKLT
jgi:3-deoxy-D-manno-octulosonic acid hydroxylase-like protein